MLRNKNGISVIALSVVSFVILILLSTVSFSLIKNYNQAMKIEFAQELNMIQILVDDYYYKNGVYPITQNQLQISNISDEVKEKQFLNEAEYNGKYIFNVLNYDLLGISSLKYGKNVSNEYDRYVVSIDTGTVYYAKGLNIDNEYYYTLDDELYGLLNGDNKIDINSDDGIIFKEQNMDDLNKIVTVKIPKKYEINSVKLENEPVELVKEEFDYSIYEVKVSQNCSINIEYKNDLVDKKVKYLVKFN